MSTKDLWFSIAMEAALIGIAFFCTREVWEALRSGEFRRSILNPYGPWSRKAEPIGFAFYLSFAGLFTAVLFAVLAASTVQLGAEIANLFPS